MNPMPSRSAIVLGAALLALSAARYAAQAAGQTLAFHGALRWLCPRTLLGMLLAPSPSVNERAHPDPAPVPPRPTPTQPAAAPPRSRPESPVRLPGESVALCDTDARLLGAVDATHTRGSPSANSVST